MRTSAPARTRRVGFAVTRIASLWAEAGRFLQRRWQQFFPLLFPANRGPRAIAASVFLGVFVGVLPTTGFALPLTAALAALLRIPHGPALVASFVATPPTQFLLFYPAAYFLGRTLHAPPPLKLDFLHELSLVGGPGTGHIVSRLWHDAHPHVMAFLSGVTLVAMLTGLVGAALVYVVLRRRALARA
jgi:uncharacterized protein (DUF2062 family)